MGFTEREQQQSRCPCYSIGGNFQQVLDLKDNGLVIYSYTNLKEKADATENTAETAIILENTKSFKIRSAELLPELDENKIPCPRCRQILRHAQELLANVPSINKHDVIGVCDHCRLRAKTREPCIECKKIVHKFLSTSRRQKEDSKKYVKQWLASIGHLIDTPHKLTQRTHSETDIDLPKLEKVESVDKILAQPMFRSEVSLSDTDLLKKRKPQRKPVLASEKGVYFTDSSPTEIIRAAEAESKITVSHVDETPTKTKQIPKYGISKRAKHESSYLTDEEINIQRKMAKYRHNKKEIEQAIENKEKRMAEFKKFMQSRRKFSDHDLHKDLSFYFPRASQISLRKPAAVSSSQIIRFIRAKMGFKTDGEEEELERERRSLLKLDKKRLDPSEKRRLSQEKAALIAHKDKQQIFGDQELYEKELKEMDDMKRLLQEGPLQAKIKDRIIKEQKSVTEHKTREFVSDVSDATSIKSYPVSKAKREDKEPSKFEYTKRTLERKKPSEGQYTERTRYTDDKKKATEEQKRTIGDKDIKPMSKEYKEKETKIKHLDEAKVHTKSKGEKKISTRDKTPVAEKETTRVTSDRTDTIRPERIEKDKEIRKQKQIEKSQDDLKKIFRGKQKMPIDAEKRPKEDKDQKAKLEEGITQAKPKELKREKAEKTETIARSDRKEKDKITKQTKKREDIEDTEKKDIESKKYDQDKKSQPDKRLVDKEEKRTKLQEAAVQAKLKDVTKKEKKALALKSETVLKQEHKKKEKTTQIPKKIDHSAETLKASVDLKKGFADPERKVQAEKSLIDKEEKKKQLDEGATQPKVKGALPKKKMSPPIPPDDKKTKEVASEKEDTTSKPEPKEKDKGIRSDRKKGVADLDQQDRTEKQLTEKEEKKRKLEEGAIQAKVKGVLSKMKMLPSLPPGDKKSKQITSDKEDTVSKLEPKEKDKATQKSRKKDFSDESLIVVDTKKGFAELDQKARAEKQLQEKEEKQRLLEEKAIQSKVKGVVSKIKVLPSITQVSKMARPVPFEKVDTASKIKQKEQGIQMPPKGQAPIEVGMTAIKKMMRTSIDKAEQYIVDIKGSKSSSANKLARGHKVIQQEDDILTKSLRLAKPAYKPEPGRPTAPTPAKIVSKKELIVKMTQIKLRKPSNDDIMLNLIRIKQSEPRSKTQQVGLPVDVLLMKMRDQKDRKSPYLLYGSDMDMEYDLFENRLFPQSEIGGIIIGENLLKYRPSSFPEDLKEQELVPLLFKSEYFDEPLPETPKVITEVPEDLDKVDPEARKGIIRYALSDRTFIEKGWTLLPTEKVVRKMNVYRMRPAHPEFDWFEHNKHKRLIHYDTNEKFAEFDDNGRGRWYYKNGRLALDYYDAEETNAQQRFVVYSSGEPDERGRTHPITVLATFDYLGNGIVLDHAGKIRLKYNQTEGVVLDRSIGPVSHWKWHTLNDPPVLQQVMIDTQMSHKDPHILKLGGPADNKTRPDNEEMLAIEFDNFVKDKNKKLSQKFKPFQIKMKALKINEHFSLRVLDQATIYLIFRDGSTNLKLNIGMVLDHHEIVDTDTAEVGEVSNNLERLPARTDSLAGMQRSIALAQRFERSRTERERRLRPLEPCASADQLVAGASRPLRPPLRTVPLVPTGSTSNVGFCRCNRKPSSNVYYNTRLT